MSNEIQVFSNEQFGNVRVVVKDGEPWFVAADVCDSFGETNRNRAMQSLDADEKGYTQMTTPGGMQQMSIVNEPGLYALLFAMQPKKARGVTDEYIEERERKLKSYKRWVTHEVLPSIRKHGMYITSAIDSDALFKIAAAMQEKEKQIASLQQEKQVMLPKAEFYDAVVESPDAVDMAVAAKTLNMGVGRNTMFKILREAGILQKDNTPYQTYVDRGYFRCIESKFSMPDGTQHINIKTVVQQKGLDFIRKVILNAQNRKEYAE